MSAPEEKLRGAMPTVASYAPLEFKRSRSVSKRGKLGVRSHFSSCFAIAYRFVI
ncbi:hypothetical protein [Nostoc sp. TCL240-02]|uniref:hypothetical protein n=1 Tax=Nostoc sp. TCL240-02 TaxID=2572090 RepID=UPI00157F8A94|nr:hypothetical protein [Nostoc sp. TCL240-02]